MSWLMRLLGRTEREAPPHVQQARKVAAEAMDATSQARDAAGDYWAARKEDMDRRVRLAKIDAALGAHRKPKSAR